MEEKVIDYVAKYNSAMRSVNVVNNEQRGDRSEEEWQSCIRANAEHLKIMLQIDWPEELDLTPIHAAIAAYEN
jgi:flagellar capping protein FliD